MAQFVVQLFAKNWNYYTERICKFRTTPLNGRETNELNRRAAEWERVCTAPEYYSVGFLRGSALNTNGRNSYPFRASIASLKQNLGRTENKKI